MTLVLGSFTLLKIINVLVLGKENVHWGLCITVLGFIYYYIISTHIIKITDMKRRKMEEKA